MDSNNFPLPKTVKKGDTLRGQEYATAKLTREESQSKETIAEKIGSLIVRALNPDGEISSANTRTKKFDQSQ
jgi:hypothetical protein